MELQITVMQERIFPESGNKYGILFPIKVENIFHFYGHLFSQNWKI